MFVHHLLHSYLQLDLSSGTGDALHVLQASGRNLQASIPAKWLTLWLPLSGELEMSAQECRWMLQAGDFLVWRDSSLRVDSHLPGWWIAVCGSMQAWSPYLRPRPGHRETAVFPRESECPKVLRRLLVRIARMARAQETLPSAESALSALCLELAEHQGDLHGMLERCNGRNLQRRQQTLTRLLWVRHLIEKREDARLDLAYLAASANYSPCHLIRSHRNVFGETPSEYGARLRARRAWKLVRETSMPLCEITEALGFESQSAFCRAFKNTHGMTASQARHRLRASRLAA